TSFAQRSGVFEDPLFQRLAMFLELLPEALVPESQDLHCEDGRVLPPVEADGGHGHAGRHLRHAQDGVQVQLAAHRHSDDRFRGMGRDGAGERGGEARDRDEDFRRGVPNQISEEVRRAMGGCDDHVVSDAELVEERARLFPDLRVGLGTEDDEDVNGHRWDKVGSWNKGFPLPRRSAETAQLFMIARRKRPIAAAAPMIAARITPIDSTMMLTRLTLELNGPAYQAHRVPTINPPTKRPTPIFRLFPLPK